MRKTKIEFTAEEINSMVKYYEDGLSFDRIGELFNCSGGTIWNRMHTLVTVRPKTRKLMVLTEDELALMVKHYESGLTFQVIGDLLGYNQSFVWKNIRPLVESRLSYKESELYSTRLDCNGYVLIRLDKNDPFISMANGLWCYEHRYVMAQYLDRSLFRNESVHHINNDRIDNRIENLELRIGSHGRGATYRCTDCGSNRIHSVPLED